MFVINGIAYAGDPKPIIKVTSVRVLDGYKLLLKFTSGETKTFDFEPLLSMPCFAPLKNKLVFNSVYVDYGCPVWQDGNIDISPQQLYENGVNI